MFVFKELRPLILVWSAVCSSASTVQCFLPSSTVHWLLPSSTSAAVMRSGSTSESALGLVVETFVHRMTTNHEIIDALSFLGDIVNKCLYLCVQA